MKGDILACYGDTWIDKAIRLVLNDRITHVACDIGNNQIIETSYFGVKINDISIKKEQFIRLRCPFLNEAERELIVYYHKQALGRPYDYIQMYQIFMYKVFGVKVLKNNPVNVICAELEWEIYKKIGYDLVPSIEDKTYLVPEDLLDSPFLIQVNN